MLCSTAFEHLPGDRDPKPVWLLSSRTGMTGTDVDLRRQAFLRRFDLEHTFRLLKQTLGWTVPFSFFHGSTACSSRSSALRAGACQDQPCRFGSRHTVATDRLTRRRRRITA